MVYTKLERSFDSDELHKILKTTLTYGHAHHGHHGHSRAGGVHKIERPPLPRGSQAYEQAKDELEIERQSQLNGAVSLPVPSSHAGRHSPKSRLAVPASSPQPPRRHGSDLRPGSARGGHRTPSGRLSPRLPTHDQMQHLTPENAFLGTSRPSSGRRSPLLDVPSCSTPRGGSAKRSRGRSPSPRLEEGENSPRNRSSSFSRPRSRKQ